tara:strand:- start:198 stop:329 length:132 start_codon:yes stop_codon:yes gene_type:complete
MQQDLDNQTPIQFPTDQDKTFISKSIKIIDLINKKVQITYSLN